MTNNRQDKISCDKHCPECFDEGKELLSCTYCGAEMCHECLEEHEPDCEDNDSMLGPLSLLDEGS